MTDKTASDADTKASESIQAEETPPMFIIDWESLGYLDIDWVE